MADDRRAHRRFKIALEATLESDAGKFAAMTTDLSRGGCFLPTFKEVAIGATMRVLMALPGVGEVACKATVRWAGKQPGGQTGLGISFDEMTAEHRARFDAFCAAKEV